MRVFVDLEALRHRAFCFAVAAAALSTPATTSADDPEMRTWKDVSGRFKIEARYGGIEGENVILRKADGTQMQIALEKLSSADRRYAEDLKKKAAEDDPFKPRVEDPFKPRAAAPAGAMSGRPAAAAATPVAPAVPVTAGGEPVEIRPDWSSAQLALLPPEGDWKASVAAPSAAAAEAAKPRAVPVPQTSDFFEHRKGYVLNFPGTHALIGYVLDRNKPGTTRIVLCDLASGKPLGQAKSEGGMAPLALSDSGGQALMRREEFGFGNSDRLELWSLTPQALVKNWKMSPYGDLQGGDRDVKWAAFLGSNRFATLGGKGKLTIWDMDPVRPTLTVQADDSCVPARSPDGKYLAFAGDGKVGLLDVDAGQVAALQALPQRHSPWPALAFSTSGKRFACVCGGRMYVWNTEDGSLHRDILLTPIAVGPNTPPTWTDDEHVLVANRYLIDVESQVKLWDYDGAEAVASGRDGYCWFLIPSRPNQSGAVVPARLPQPNALQALKQALADPNYFVMRPGATISINADGIPDAAQRAKVVESLTSRLSGLQVKVAPGAPLALQASVEAGKEEEVAYRTIGRGFQVDKFKIHPQISRVKLAYQGQQMWESSASTLPHIDFAHLGPNESLADHVRKFEKPNYAYFDQVELPRLMPKPRPGGSFTLGKSQVSSAGVR